MNFYKESIMINYICILPRKHHWSWGSNFRGFRGWSKPQKLVPIPFSWIAGIRKPWSQESMNMNIFSIPVNPPPLGGSLPLFSDISHMKIWTMGEIFAEKLQILCKNGRFGRKIGIYAKISPLEEWQWGDLPLKQIKRLTGMNSLIYENWCPRK